MALTVGEVARRVGISIRALHHYDAIGLVSPSGRSASGYRLYQPGDLDRLAQVLRFRELGFGLEQIGRILADPSYDRREALLMQRQLLAEKAEGVAAMVRAIDAALDELEEAEVVDEQRGYPSIERFDQSRYEDEVRERWGHTEAYRESARRTQQYTKADWEAMQAELGAIHEAFAARLDAGTNPADPTVLELAERHRDFISRWFYACSIETHQGLGELYISDPRFEANIDRGHPGLAAYLCAAFRANAERNGA